MAFQELMQFGRTYKWFTIAGTYDDLLLLRILVSGMIQAGEEKYPIEEE